MTQRYAIGVDIGGSHAKIGRVSSTGRILKETWVGSKGAKPQRLMDDIAFAILKRRKQASLSPSGIGIGCPGSIDSRKGMVLYSNNLKRKKFPMKRVLEEKTSLVVKRTNDANAALLGEVRFGRAKGLLNVVLLTLGTGLGSGILVNGQLLEGRDGTGGEIGHAFFYPEGRLCTCGRKGCREEYVSATGLIKTAEEFRKKDVSSSLHGKELSIKTVFEESTSDPCAKRILSSFIQDLKEVIVSIDILFKPDRILLGGGVSDFSEYFLPMLRKEIRDEKSGFEKKSHPRIAVAKRKNKAGILGSASLWL